MTVVCESGNLVCAMLAGIGVHQTSLRCHENSLLVPVQVNKSLIFVYVVTSISFMQNYKHDILIALQKRNEVPSSYHGIVKKEKRTLSHVCEKVGHASTRRFKIKMIIKKPAAYIYK